MADDCEHDNSGCGHDKVRVTLDTDDGPKVVCPICDDVELTTLDGDGE